MPSNMFAHHTNIFYLLDQILQKSVESTSSLSQSHLPSVFQKSKLKSIHAFFVLDGTVLRYRSQEVILPVKEIVVEIIVDT